MINYLAVIVATIVAFIVGGIWYMPLFGKLWGKMHGFEAQSKAKQAEMQKGMAPLLIAQFLTTLVMMFVFAIFITYGPQNWSLFGLAAFFWIGFVVPTQVGAVLFGGTDPKWVLKKILVMAGGALVSLEAAALVFNLFAK